MEKSVLLELLDKKNKSYENMVRKASIFKLSDETIAKINELFYKMDNITKYVKETNIKETTIEKINNANTEAVKVIKEADEYLDSLLKVAVNRLVLNADAKDIEKTITTNLTSDLDTLKYAIDKKLVRSSKGKIVLSKKATDALANLKKDTNSLTKENIETITALEKVLSTIYLNDAKLNNTDDRLAALDINDKEEETFVGYLDLLSNTLTSKRGKSNGSTKAAGTTKGTGTDTKGSDTKGNDTETKETESSTKDETKQVRKVKKVTKSTEKDVQRNKKTSSCLAKVTTAILLGVILLATILTIKQCSKNCNKNNTPEDTTKEPGIETTVPVETTEPVVVIPVININDETKLEEYAKYIQDELKKQDIDMSVEDIKNAIKLVNVDYLDEKPFDNREQIYNATEDAGTIATKLGTSTVLAEDPNHENNLITERTLDDMIKNVVPGFNKENLNLTKNENGYSIYNLLDQLTYILEHEETYTVEDREMAAKLYNEVMARKVRTFTLTPNSSVGQYYLALGMYEAEHQNVKDLTAGRLYGPMYGDEEQIDGTYGFICVEELQKYTAVGNTNNGFYTTYADLMLKDKALTKSLD